MATIKQHWIKGISQSSAVGFIIDTVLHYNRITGICPSSYNYPYYSINKLYNNNIQHMPYRRGFYSKWFTVIPAYISRMSGLSRIRTYDPWCCKHNALPTDPCIRHPLELEYTWFEALLNMTWPSLLKALYASVLTQQWSTQHYLIHWTVPSILHLMPSNSHLTVWFLGPSQYTTIYYYWLSSSHVVFPNWHFRWLTIASNNNAVWVRSQIIISTLPPTHNHLNKPNFYTSIIFIGVFYKRVQ